MKYEEADCYWLSAPWATGAVWVRSGVIVDTIKIFRKLKGQRFNEVVKRGKYQYKKLTPQQRGLWE